MCKCLIAIVYLVHSVSNVVIDDCPSFDVDEVYLFPLSSAYYPST